MEDIFTCQSFIAKWQGIVGVKKKEEDNRVDVWGR